MPASRLDFGSVGGERESDRRKDGSRGASGDGGGGSGGGASGDGGTVSGFSCGSNEGGAARELDISITAQDIPENAVLTSAGQGTEQFPPPPPIPSASSSHPPPCVLSPVPEAEVPISPDSAPPSATATVARTKSSPSPSTSSAFPSTSSLSNDSSSIAPAAHSRTLHLPSLRPPPNSAAEDSLEEPFNAPAPDLPSPVTPSPRTAGSHSTALWSPHTPRDFESSLSSSPQAAPLSPRAPPSAETSPCNRSLSNESPSKASPSTPPSNRFPPCERFLSAVKSHSSSSFPPSPSEESYSQHVMRRISPPPVMPPSAAGPAYGYASRTDCSPTDADADASADVAAAADAGSAAEGNGDSGGGGGGGDGCGGGSGVGGSIRGVRKSAQGDEELREQVQRWDGMMREEAGQICRAATVPFVTGFMEASGGGGAHSLVDAYELKGDEELREQVQQWDGMMREEAGRICRAAAVPFVTGFMEASGGGGAHSLVDAYELKGSWRRVEGLVLTAWWMPMSSRRAPRFSLSPFYPSSLSQVRLHLLLERWGLVQDSMATERPLLVLPHLGSAIAAL
ncbi:unnamed protein product [Closterium sp. Yama58-4]|nr:unnamed protein product [Closterium sp. Yama58-4]